MSVLKLQTLKPQYTASPAVVSVTSSQSSCCYTPKDPT
jgi:hypothetical protein